MAKVPLTVGAYTAKSVIAEAQRCVNLYMEKNPQDSMFPTTHYPTPGLVTVATSAKNIWRGLFQASNGTLFGACGDGFFIISPSWVLTQIGSLATSFGPVSMVDNGTELLIVDGSAGGYKVVLGSNAFSAIVDAAFYGGNTVQFADGFFILPRANTIQFYISLAFQTTFDPVDFASKTGYSDKLVTLIVTKRYIYLLGSVTGEVWFNQGGTAFPYTRMPGAFMQHGCIAPATAAQVDGQAYWLSQSPQGKCIVVKTENYDAKRISTHAIENEFQSYSSVSDAQAFTMQVDGHFWYVLTFPTANKTWVYDLSTEQWHEWNWTDSNGNLNRHRANCFVFAYGQAVVGDWQNGNLYVLDPNVMTDFGGPITRIRGFPHLTDDDGSRIMYREFIADFQVGSGANADTTPVFLRWSDTKGQSWGNPIASDIGKEGEYLRSVQFQRLGMARDRVFEISWSTPAKTALNGAFVQFAKANQ